MTTKYGGDPAGTIWPAEVRLMRSLQPQAKSSSATSTAKDAPPAPDNTNGLIGQLELVQIGVVTRPGLKGPRRPGLAQLPNQVAVRVQDADRGHIQSNETLLPSRLAQQRCGDEYRGQRRILVGEDGGCAHRRSLEFECRGNGRRQLTRIASASPKAKSSRDGFVQAPRGSRAIPAVCSPIMARPKGARPDAPFACSGEGLG